MNHWYQECALEVGMGEVQVPSGPVALPLALYPSKGAWREKGQSWVPTKV